MDRFPFPLGFFYPIIIVLYIYKRSLLCDRKKKVKIKTVFFSLEWPPFPLGELLSVPPIVGDTIISGVFAATLIRRVRSSFNVRFSRPQTEHGFWAFGSRARCPA